MANEQFDKHCEHEAPPKPGPERDRYIHEHDCPRIWEFWKKYALGSKLCPSCLLCGVQAFDPADWAIRHAELPDIYICKGCAEKARAPSSTAAAHPGASARVCPTCGGNGNHRLARTEALPCETCAGIGYVALSATASAEIALWRYWTKRVLDLPDHNFPLASTFAQLRDAMREQFDIQREGKS